MACVTKIVSGAIANDDAPECVLGAFSDLYRLLKPDSVCVSFYGWTQVDAFFREWRSAGFRPVSHMVWVKEYASGAGFLRYRHEQAFVLAKGRPPIPARPLDDIQPWVYSGNSNHPTQKAVRMLTPLIEAFTQPGQLVLDPFAGSGSTLVAAAITGRRYLGIELETEYCEVARRRLAHHTGSTSGPLAAAHSYCEVDSEQADALGGLFRWLQDRGLSRPGADRTGCDEALPLIVGVNPGWCCRSRVARRGVTRGCRCSRLQLPDPARL
jgi:site-specific DNA-methyltransferase (adenine-specific)